MFPNKANYESIVPSFLEIAKAHGIEPEQRDPTPGNIRCQLIEIIDELIKLPEEAMLEFIRESYAKAKPEANPPWMTRNHYTHENFSDLLIARMGDSIRNTFIIDAVMKRDAKPTQVANYYIQAGFYTFEADKKWEDIPKYETFKQALCVGLDEARMNQTSIRGIVEHVVNMLNSVTLHPDMVESVNRRVKEMAQYWEFENGTADTRSPLGFDSHWGYEDGNAAPYAYETERFIAELVEANDPFYFTMTHLLPSNHRYPAVEMLHMLAYLADLKNLGGNQIVRHDEEAVLDFMRVKGLCYSLPTHYVANQVFSRNVNLPLSTRTIEEAEKLLIGKINGLESKVKPLTTQNPFNINVR